MAPLTSSAINKGKKFAPKAAVARRRPAQPAGQPAAQSATQPAAHPVEATPASEPTPSSTNLDASAGASQPESTSTQPDQQHVPTTPLPTPPATQQSPVTRPPPAVAQQAARQPTPPPPASLPQLLEPSPLSLARSDVSLQKPATSLPTASPAPTSQTIVGSTPPVTHPEPHQSDSSTDHVSSRQQSEFVPPSPTQLAGQKRKRPTPPPSAPSQQSTAEQATQPMADQHALPTVEADHEAALINSLINHQEQSRAPVAQMLPPANSSASAPKPRAKRQRKNAATQPSEEAADPSQAVSGAREDNTDAAAVAKLKKPRASRAKRAPKSAATVVEDENGNIVETQEPAARPTPKPRQPRQKKKQAQQVEGQDGEPGEDDPVEDPENHEIDVTETTMFELTKDRGLGKVSERETKMAAIDWDEVHRKRVAEAEAIRAGIDPATLNNNTRPVENAEGGEGAEGEPSAETPQAPPAVVTGPRLRIDAEGNLVVDEESLRIDRQAQAERNAENLIVTENDDLTKRVNQMSWINERRRDPTDRVPFFKMKSDPWSDEETDRFYEALRMFGTDFFIISKMFPPKTRRQIKLKFIREERLDADRVNRVLAGEAVPMNLESFAEATGQELGGFKDPRELEEELRVEGEEQRVEIARKKKEMEEAKEQRDIQMAAREKDQEERAAQRREKAAMRQNKRRGIFGNGTF
ncbi:hypothetical protein E4T42_00169 [Aureobasidium subglaciale]|uniref:SANT domain-containing protein n=1 Tax=Aureobasidium subglaciale (strain EXF-2481) TaxID=1043005 RepID=A0A074YG80_AURSE|nr:uncharacterized protein AUEXF2481DRAFT_3522 [Aureobasidium subglaciale EXF-2481]KAI5209333.1 hypothetical protein E4T38_02424 [Aureobasidium subglaciale]KAI5228030.1 hypothetical protein E4T40_02203 [Aureobasidium subglaciale]KAI5231472.1 hypothetical protein E4T41_02423 [Aureobasidium subglaciale]KAI5259454.1 hypothetical protein E4T42_00169 [Aureobasidium subglaciale]KAI5265468.1 hypothetical protein E4T46_02201 [Aureobasidium subglaciale]